MLTIEALERFGANTQEGLGRCLGDEGFLLTLVKTVPKDANFEGLRQAVEAGDLQRGFECAHALKGVLGNLALTSLYEPICTITEALRAGEERDYGPLLDEISRKHAELVALCEE